VGSIAGILVSVRGPKIDDPYTKAQGLDDRRLGDAMIDPAVDRLDLDAAGFGRVLHA
jgi:hypothetical protein